MCLLNNAAKHSKLQQKMIEGMEHGPYDDGCEKLRQEETLNGARFPVHIRKKLRPENLFLNFDDDFRNLNIVGL